MRGCAHRGRGELRRLRTLLNEAKADREALKRPERARAVVFFACSEGKHEHCARGPVWAQAAWATAGAPPVPGVPAVALEVCACRCHAPGGAP